MCKRKGWRVQRTCTGLSEDHGTISLALLHDVEIATHTRAIETRRNHWAASLSPPRASSATHDTNSSSTHSCVGPAVSGYVTLGDGDSCISSGRVKRTCKVGTLPIESSSSSEWSLRQGGIRHTGVIQEERRTARKSGYRRDS